jgi:flagellar hook-associated protein 2
VSSISSVSSSSGTLLSASGIEQLITAYVKLEQASITTLETQKDELDVKRAVYDDISSYMQELQSALEALTEDDDVYGALSASSSDEEIITASSDDDAIAGTYDVTVNCLAQAAKLSSSKQSQSNVQLGLSGTFLIGGAESRSVSDETTVENTVEDFGTASSISDDQTELGSGTYYVEVRKSSSWQFRLVDENGDAVTIADADGTGTTSGWQDLFDVKGTTFDTGRGLTISFGEGSYKAGLCDSGAASVEYTAKGTEIAVTSKDSLTDICEAINEASYADGNEVQATIVNRTLVLTTGRTGSSEGIQLSDLTGSVLSQMGFLTRSVVDSEDLADSGGVTSFDTGELVSFVGGGLTGQSELSSDRYYVEIGDGANAGKFRLVDADGNAVAIASTSGGTTATTDWIAITSGTYDTGRGLTLTLSGTTFSPTSYDDGAASIYYGRTNAITSPRDASLTINGLEVTRSSNSGLGDIVDGLSFDLLATGDADVTVDSDTSGVAKKVTTILSKLNSLLSYLKSKTEPQADTQNSTSDQTIYTSGVLGTDWSIRNLRRNLMNDMSLHYPDAAEGSYTLLSQIGITLESDDDGALSYSLTDASALDEALSSDVQGVQDLLEYVFGEIEDRINPYLEGDYAIIESAQAAIDSQMERLDDQIESADARLLWREEALREQYQNMQAEITTMTSEYQAWQAIASTYSSYSTYDTST